MTGPEDGASRAQEHVPLDPASVDLLFTRYAEPVLRIVRVRMGPVLRAKEDADDLAHDAFVDALKGIGAYQPREGAEFVHWLARVTESAIRDRAKYWDASKRNPARERRAESLRKRVESSTVGWEPLADATTASEHAARSEEKRILDDCLAELAEPHRDVILLRIYEGGSWEWVAEQLGSPSPAAAEQSYRRARQALEPLLKRRLPHRAGG